ncbi:unnamed protein product [Microthlaspi erraticum]|uniref:F-box domain-containing protein n=1 Tax=Microthlaspi erraticum TaxID=1685480 RepID=A0A6D2K962_9BRAS|nr:unnamed protein product [Microthlaspi erraticum]
MEKQEEMMTRKIKRRRREREPSSLSQSTTYVPLHLIPEILAKLPAKSVLRFRCVSKLCSSITTDPDFIKSFEAHSSTRPRLLVCSKEGDKLSVSSLSQQNQNRNKSRSYSSSQPIESYHMTYPNNYPITIKTESVHGLICFYNLTTLVVWNPSMRKFLDLPMIGKESKDATVFLGYDPSKGIHKVVCMPWGRYSDECHVLTLGGSAQEPWRTVGINHSRHCPLTGETMLIFIDNASTVFYIIMPELVLMRL